MGSHNHGICVRDFVSTDFDRLINWVPDEKSLIQFAGAIFRFPLDRDQLSTYLTDPRRKAFVVMHDDIAVGHAEIYRESAETMKLCRILIGDPAARGKGYGRKLISLLIGKAFSVPGVQSLKLHVFEWNTAAIRCYEGAGFKLDPDFSAEFNRDSIHWKVLRMTMLKPESGMMKHNTDKVIRIDSAQKND